MAADPGRDGRGQQDNEEIASMMRNREQPRATRGRSRSGICGKGRRWERRSYLRPLPASWRRGCFRSLSSPEIRQVDAAPPHPPDE